MIHVLGALPEFNLVLLIRRLGYDPQQLFTGVIVVGVLLTSVVVGLHGSLLYLALPLVVGTVLLVLRQPALGLILTLFGGMILPFTGPGGVNLTMLGMVALTALWFLSLIVNRSPIQIQPASTSRPALGMLLVVGLALLMGQLPWYRAQAAPLTAQIGGAMVFAVSIAAFLFVGRQFREVRWLALLTWLMIGYGALHMVGWIEPRIGYYTQHLFQEGATGSMFWTWVVALAFSQTLFNRQLQPVTRIALLSVVIMTFYVAYGLNGEWKSGWLPPLISVVLLLLLRYRQFSLPLTILGALPAANLIKGALASDAYSYSTRIEAWAIIGEIVKANPILGLGPANYYWYTPLFRIRGYMVHFNSHNQYVDLIAQTGFLGLFAFLWFMGTVGWVGWKLRLKVADGFEKAYVYGALSGWAATLAAAAFGDWVLPFVYNVGLAGVRSTILPWIFLGGLVVLERKYQHSAALPMQVKESQ